MSRNTVERLFATAGITINGDRPYDVRVLNDKFYDRLLADGSLGAGESYMDGWWECDRIDELMRRALSVKMDTQLLNWRATLDVLKTKLFNQQKVSRAYQVGEQHYDIGNELYEKMLDKRMVYSGAYWQGASTLDEAQENKLELICQKLGLETGMSVLDIGCGWGSFAQYAAEKHGVSVVGITVSQQQVELARERCKGLPIKIELSDYRDLRDKFDRIVSVGMFEHVGYKNYARYMKIAQRCLEPGGLFLLQTIGSNQSRFQGDPWSLKYIFPNSMLPSIKQIGQAIEDVFVMEDWENFGPDYDKTLMSWYDNFTRHWDELKSQYDERFYRMWTYYLLSFAGAFRARDIQVWQILLSKQRDA